MLTILAVAKDKADHVTVAFMEGLIVKQQAEVSEVQDILIQLEDQTEKADLRQWDRDLKSSAS
jgi:ferritin